MFKNTLSLIAALSLLLPACASHVGDERDPLEGLDPALFRQPLDTVGYTHSEEGIAQVVRHALEPEKALLESNRFRLGLDDDHVLIGAISPHDDYVYAQQVYIHAYPHLLARHVIVIGVAHRAREFPESEGRLVFDDFPAWHGPYGGVPISPLREALLAKLPEEDCWVSGEMHAKEHSIEGTIPFLQHFDRKVSIVPILVPYMSWERLNELAGKTAGIVAKCMDEMGLSLGRDVAILISSDSVHYGDLDWGDRDFAEFGTNGTAYDKAVDRDLGLIQDFLTGPVTAEKTEGFYRAVNAEDFHTHKITWCGRFSIPFGLALLEDLAAKEKRPPPNGTLLRYGTTLNPGRSDPGVDGLSVTAKASLRHWVGFASIAYQ